MRRKIIIIFLLTIMIILSSCFGGGDLRIKNKDLLLFGEDKVAYKSIKKVVEAIKEQDRDTLKSVFSKQALAEADDFESSMDCLFEFIQGEIESLEIIKGLGIYEGKNDDGSGRSWKIIDSIGDIETSEQKYHISIQEVTKHSKEPERIGISSLSIISAEYWNEDYVYRGDFGLPEDFETFGIVVDFQKDIKSGN